MSKENYYFKRWNLRGKIICTKCGEIGTLEIQSKDKFRVNHDKMKNGVLYPKRCYLGSLSKHITNLKAASHIREDLIDPILVEELSNTLNSREKILEEIKNSSFATLIITLIKLSKKLGTGWRNESHFLVKQARCPHCTKRIAVRFVRIGKNPRYGYGEYNIEHLDIERGDSGYTSGFKRDFWFRGISKGSSKIKSPSFTDDEKNPKFFTKE